MIAYGEEGHTPKPARCRSRPGSGLTNRIMIDQHFRQRDRPRPPAHRARVQPVRGRRRARRGHRGVHRSHDTSSASGAITIGRRIGADALVDRRDGNPIAGDRRVANIRLNGHRRRHVRSDRRAAQSTDPESWSRDGAPRTPRLPRSQPLRALPRHAPHGRPRRLEDLAEREDPGFVDALLTALLPRSRTCSVGVEGGFVQRLTEDGGTWLGTSSSTSRSSSSSSRRAGHLRQDALEGTPGRYHVVYEYEEERVGEAAGAGHCCTTCSPDEARRERAEATEKPFDFKPSSSRIIDFAQRRQLGRRRARWCAPPGARHPVAAASTTTARPVRPRQVPEAHPGHRDPRDAPHRGRDRVRQGRETNHPRRPSACPSPPAPRAAEGGRRQANRLGFPSRSSRSTPITAAASRSISRGDDGDPRRVRQGAASTRAPWSWRLPAGLRPPHAGRQRRSSSRSPSACRATCRRRRAHDRGAGRHRELSDPRRGIPATRRCATRLRAPPGRRLLARGRDEGPCSRRRALLPPHTGNLSTGGTAIDPPTWSTPTTARWRCARPRAPSASTSAASTSSPRHLAELPRGRRRHLRGQRRARLPHARGAHRGASRATSPGR